MFDNIIAQGAAEQLKSDIMSNRLAPSMLFFGPPAAGKGSTAIELARALSCRNGAASWGCSCPDCARHRSLLHSDFAMIGPRPFASEIKASRDAFLRDHASTAGRLLFIRSLRKMMARFSPAVWEHESKSGKVNPLPLLQSLEENLDELESLDLVSTGKAVMESLSDSILKDALKIIDGDCISDPIPIDQVRKVAYWSRLTPEGKRKTLIIENADRMKNEARNSLLKLLEEPPDTISIVLTARHRESLIDTILSRLRPYRFVARSAENEMSIIRKIFRDPGALVDKNAKAQGLVESYLDKHMPLSSEKMFSLAAFFAAAAARSAAVLAKRKGSHEIPAPLLALGEYCYNAATKAGLVRTTDARQTIPVLISQSSDFAGRSFSRFLSSLLNVVSFSMEQCPVSEQIALRELWKKYVSEADAAYSVWHQRPELILESMYCRLTEAMAAL